VPKKRHADAPIDAAISEEIKNEQAKLRPGKRAAQQKHAKRLRQMRKLLECSEEEFRQVLKDERLSAEHAAEAMRIWRANRS
jgi:hypothetical protein